MGTSSSKIFFTGLKFFILVIVGLLWKLYYDNNCSVFIGATFLVTFFLTISFSESSLLYRKSLASIIFLDRSWIYSWLHTKWLSIMKSMFITMFLTMVFLINMLHWSTQISIIMLLDGLFIYGLYMLIHNRISVHAKENMQGIATRRIVMLINVLLMTPVVVISLLYTYPSDLLDASLLITLQNSTLILDEVTCNIVSWLYAFDLLKENMSWWIIHKVSSVIESKEIKLIGWLLFLAFQTLYIWIFTKIILSTTIPFSTIFMKSEK